MTISYIPPSLITVPPDRQRQLFNPAKLAELAETIEREGLIHPIAVERDLDSKQFLLLAGERRLRAMIDLLARGVKIRCGENMAPDGCIPGIVYDPRERLNRFAIELMENIQREDLTWQERAKALTAYHQLRAEQKGAAGQTFKETAAEVGKVIQQTVAAASFITPHLNDPEVAKAKDLKEALKIVKKKEEVVHRAKLAKTFNLQATPHTLLKGDFRVHLLSVSEFYDCLIADPPYGIGADSFGDQASTGHAYGDKEDNVWPLLDNLAEVSFRACKPDSFAYVFCDIRHWERLSTLFSLAGWIVWHRPLIWDKIGNGMLPQPDYGPKNTYECILYARKGDRRVIRQAAPDVLSHVPVTRLQHGAQKPASLLSDLLGRVCLPGDKILDTCVGSGTTFIAANQLKLVCTGIELEEDSYNLAVSRMSLTREDGAATVDESETPEIEL